MSSRTQSEKDSERTTSFETAARTRPLSIQDILLQREKKVAAEAKKTKEELQELQDNGKGKPNHLESGRGYKSRKDLKDIPMEGSKKENVRDKPRKDSKKDDVRHTLKEGTKNENTRYIPRDVSKKENLKNRPKDGSRMDDLKDTPKVPRKDDQRDAPMKGSKKQRSSIGDDSKSAGKDKSTHGLHKLGTSMSGRADESKDGNHGEIRERTGDATISESLKGPGKRWSGETVDNDRIKERSEKLWNETKRKVRGFDDEKSSEVERLVLKKHGSARFQDSKYSDRNDGRKEYGKPYHEEPRSKRRRSRSRDHDLEGRDRSVSLSPREQRHSYRGHDHDKYPPYYSVDKSRRKYAETDRHRTSGNGGHSGMSYRRYESRLGGYSPRKRKTAPQDEQATTKTAPPVVRSPEKKSATWDQPPAGADQSNFFTTLQPIVSQVTSSVSVSFTAPKHPATTPETVLAGNSSSIDSVQLTQATRPLRRLHIENLPSSASEDMLIGCLNDFLLSSGANNIQRSKQPCLSCTINKEKRQAFVEFLTPEDATAALSFDGRSFNGSALKIRRPKEYIEMANVAPKKPAEEIKLTSDVVADSPHKIFVAGISGVISPEMLVEIVSSFGQLAAYRFLCNGDPGGRCAFLEYIDHSITYKACAGLNGMKLGGCILTAVQVFPNHLEVRNEASPFYGIPDSARALLEVPTKVLQLKNVFDREEYLLLSKSELEELLEDVRMECARFGAVKSINIVEYPASSDSTTGDIIVKPEDGPVKLEPTEHRANDNCTDTGTECSLPNKGINVPGHSDPTETKDVVPVSEGQDHKELDKLCECDAPVAADQYTDLGYINARAAGPTLDQHTEADHMDSMQADHVDSMQADHNATAVGDDSAVGKGHQEPRTLEICSSTTPGDVGERSERENEQQDANDVSESDAEKVPAADTRDDALVSGTNVLEAGSILVEFMRKEAACMAAHCLHGRCFGNRTVSAGYAPHDLYLQRYPR